MEIVKEFKYEDIFVVSEMLDNIEFKHYLEYLERKLYQLDKKLNSKVNENLEPIDKLELKNKNDKIKQDALVVDLLGFITTKAHKSKHQIDLLIMSYHQINQEDLKKLNIFTTIKYLKDMLKNGLIEMIFDVIKEFKEDGTMDEIMKFNIPGLKKTLD